MILRFVTLLLTTWGQHVISSSTISHAIETTKSIRSSRVDKDSGRNESRSLSQLLAGYQSYSFISDYSAIDNDQAAIEVELEKYSDEGLTNAKAIYEDGGHSSSYASLDIEEPLSTALLKTDTLFSGKDRNGNKVIGMNYVTRQFEHLRLKYVNQERIGAHYGGCQVGALPLIDAETTDHCFAPTGTVSATLNNGDYREFTYKYNPLKDNHNGRNIQNFSRLIPSSSLTCARCPFKDAEYAYEYYGTGRYGDELITAAFTADSITIEKIDNQQIYTVGTFDFSVHPHVYRSEFIKKATLGMNIFMYVLREFEDALGDCKYDREGAGHNWDEAVALYTGSLEGENENGSESGKLLHRLADTNCAYFKTCSKKGNAVNAKSKVNHDLSELFELGQEQVLRGECKKAIQTKERIAELMYIPLIQGTLRSAYRINYLDGSGKDKGEGAAFALSVLPRIAAANEKAAKKISDNMNVGASSTSFDDVLEGFQSVYKDMNIDCSQIGGLWDQSAGVYYKNADPCTETEGTMLIFILVAAIGAVVVAAISAIIYLRFPKNDGKDRDSLIS